MSDLPRGLLSGLEDPEFMARLKQRELLKQFPPDLNLRDSQTVSDDGDSVH
jgi:hypothetical protein